MLTCGNRIGVGESYPREKGGKISICRRDSCYRVVTLRRCLADNKNNIFVGIIVTCFLRQRRPHGVTSLTFAFLHFCHLRVHAKIFLPAGKLSSCRVCLRHSWASWDEACAKSLGTASLSIGKFCSRELGSIDRSIEGLFPPGE